MSSPVMTTSWQGALPLVIVGAIGLSRPSSTFCRMRLLVGLERQQRLVAAGIDAADQRKFRAVVVEADRRPPLLIGLLERLADVVERDRPVDVDQLALLAQHVEELAEILIRHSCSPACLLQTSRTRAPLSIGMTRGANCAAHQICRIEPGRFAMP